MATKKGIFIIVIGVSFCVTTCQRKHSESKNVTENSIETDTTVSITDSDSIELIKLIKNLFKWNDTNLFKRPDDRLGDFDVVPLDDSIYIGINWEAHSKRMLQLYKTRFFTKDFLENYQNIAVYLDKELKENPERYYVGYLPPYGNGANFWCNCQDYPDNWEEYLAIIDLKIDANSANFKWTLGGNHHYFTRAQKEDGTWRISYMELFDIKNFIW